MAREFESLRLRHLPSMTVSVEEQAQRDAIMRRVLEFISADQRIKLPDFDASRARPSDRFALVSVGLEPNPFGGKVDRFRYQFEGEEDLLHLIVTAEDGGEISVREGQEVTDFVLAGVPKALMWFKPGEVSQHFYVGHDVLIDALPVE